jgi:hypothetical protein
MSEERTTDEDRTGDRASEGRSADERARDGPEDIELGDPFRRHVADAFGFDTEPATFRELWERMLATFAAGLDRPVSAADLCTTDASPHRAVVDGESQSFRCVTDAFIFAVLHGGDATVRTVSPLGGRELTVDFDATGAAATPDGAVLSVGVERSAGAPDGPVTPERMYGRFCPYSKAFSSREEYEWWTDARPEIATEVLPLDATLTLLARLTGRAFDADGQSRVANEADCSCAPEVDC